MRAYQLLQGTGIDGLVKADLPMPKPGPGQVLVSRTVRDLALGSGFDFEPHGVHELKGVPGTWDLFAVGDERSASPAA